MANSNTGLWLVGARGNVGVTMMLGLCALRRGLASTTGLVSQLPQFAGLDFLPWDQWIVGGHDIRESEVIDEVERFHRENRVIDPSIIDQCRPDLAEIEARICFGTTRNVGPTIEGLASPRCPSTESTARAAIDRIQADLAAFQASQNLRTVIVVNLASTEPPSDVSPLPTTWDDLANWLDSSQADPLPASSLYAIAALEFGLPYVNFTPSVGADLPALDELARLRDTCHSGRDGKTGETLLKTVLAPMFACRNLQIMSWVGHNIFGNLDGRVLDDPDNKQTKVTSKDRVLSAVLDYDPQTLVSIEYIQSLGDWKTAWDHIHFRGFLDTQMTMQLTWQGCDSLLAAPLVLDLVRFTELAHRSGERGPLTFLSSFFKSPIGCTEQAFGEQFAQLIAWSEQQRRAGD